MLWYKYSYKETDVLVKAMNIKKVKLALDQLIFYVIALELFRFEHGLFYLTIVRSNELPHNNYQFYLFLGSNS